MRLVFEPPAELPASARVTVLDPMAGDPRPWIAHHAGGRVPTDRRAFETASGWQLELLTYRLGDRATIIAVFAFFDLDAAIAIDGLDDGWLAQHQADLLASLCAATPDWIGREPLTVAELWSPIAAP